MHRVSIGVLVVTYLLVMAFFAFRPFRPIPGLQYAPASLTWSDGSIHVQRNAALEDRQNSTRVRDALMKSGRMSLEIALQTDSIRQLGPAIIAAFSRDAKNRNFELGQEGNGLEFRLRTIHTGNSGMPAVLEVPGVLDSSRRQHLVITYDGEVSRMFVDGQLRGQSFSLKGGFGNWDRNLALVFGDEPAGGDGWAGRIWKIAIYDGALDKDEVIRLQSGDAVPGAVLVHDFGGTEGVLPEGLARLRYRNLFITTDAAAYNLVDCLFNIVGFVPLGVFTYLILPLRLERRKVLAGIAAPALVGLAASGTIEFLQRFILLRVPCMPDLVYNLSGTLIGGLLGWLAFSAFKNNPIKRSHP